MWVCAALGLRLSWREGETKLIRCCGSGCRGSVKAWRICFHLKKHITIRYAQIDQRPPQLRHLCIPTDPNRLSRKIVKRATKRRGALAYPPGGEPPDSPFPGRANRSDLLAQHGLGLNWSRKSHEYFLIVTNTARYSVEFALCPDHTSTSSF